ncbi:isopenicillin N synthase family oxygenase [Gammaproteobacteria bacterium]|nr:isopenicillin N synthase family oxygenase [Gammaproteobacteria bacterium]
MLPILDFDCFLQSPDSPAAKDFCEQLVKTCHETGFFYLTGHGIDVAQNNNLISCARRFFALPEAQRRAIAIGKSAHFRGYTILGDERTQDKSDWRDQIDIGPEAPAIDMDEHDPLWLRLIGPNQWPAAIPQMPSQVFAWVEKMKHVSLELFRALAMGLGHSYYYFDALMEPNPYFRIKISRYPAQQDPQASSQGLGLHHDSGLFTLIMQNEVSGLQVERNGQLLAVEPLPGAFIVNLGEMFQIATRGYLKATRHQVVSPAVGCERISVAYFMNPRLDAVFAPIPLPADIAARTDGGQNADPNDPIYSIFGENTLKIRMRSHPDVVAAHYPEAK